MEELISPRMIAYSMYEAAQCNVTEGCAFKTQQEPQLMVRLELTSSPCTLSWLQLQEVELWHLRCAGTDALGLTSPDSLFSAVLPVRAAPSMSRQRRLMHKRHPGCWGSEPVSCFLYIDTKSIQLHRLISKTDQSLLPYLITLYELLTLSQQWMEIEWYINAKYHCYP